MKLLWFVFAMTWMMAFRPLPPKGVTIHRLIIQPSSSLTIKGKSNLNSFQCSIMEYTGSDTLVLVEGGENEYSVFQQGFVGLSASSFDCGVKLITYDFRETIKSKEHPVVSIEFISFERSPSYSGMQEKFKGKLEISIGGVTKSFEMNFTMEANEAGVVHLQGGRNFTFSDFKLEPPSKMMGLIKVEDLLTVNFHLVLLQQHNY